MDVFNSSNWPKRVSILLLIRLLFSKKFQQLIQTYYSDENAKYYTTLVRLLAEYGWSPEMQEAWAVATGQGLSDLRDKGTTYVWQTKGLVEAIKALGSLKGVPETFVAERLVSYLEIVRPWSASDFHRYIQEAVQLVLDILKDRPRQSLYQPVWESLFIVANVDMAVKGLTQLNEQAGESVSVVAALCHKELQVKWDTAAMCWKIYRSVLGILIHRGAIEEMNPVAEAIFGQDQVNERSQTLKRLQVLGEIPENIVDWVTQLQRNPGPVDSSMHCACGCWPVETLRVTEKFSPRCW